LDNQDALFFPSGEDWRAWLTLNHKGKRCVWLIFFKKSSGKNGLTLAEAVEEAICFGWIDGQLRRVDEERFMVRFSPRKDGSVWSQINKVRAEKLIANGRMTDYGLAKITKAKESGFWDSAYTNKIRDEIPTDLHKALRVDKNAFDNFQKFANTYRNMYIGWVNAAKTTETRKCRIDKVVERSSHNKKQLLE
jgi:uncharacterized protein YdeI (YjbR/CyaY-like superfamily)